jgi:hypothetical protein
MRKISQVVFALLAAPLTRSEAQQATPTLRARAFADVNYLDTQRPVAEGFRLGQIAAHIVAGLSDRVTFFSEISATATNTGFGFEAERLLLRYDHSDLLKVSAGRYHTPIAYWNTAFHHGTWLQTSTARPDMVRGGSGLMPLHFVGLLTEGTFNPEPFGLRYAVGAGNGRAASIARAGDAGDANNTRAFVASASLALPRQTGFTLGGSYYLDRASPTASLAVDEKIVSVHVARERETPEIIVEYARVTHERHKQAGAPTNSNSGYVQLAYRLPGSAHAFKPYVRFERTRVPAGDTLFTPLRLNYNGALGGVRYDIAPTAALKVEYRNERFETAPGRFRSIALQLSFTFPSAHPPSHQPAPSDDKADASPNAPAHKHDR